MSFSVSALIAQFQARYPAGSLLSELLTIHQDQYVVRSIVQLGGTALASGLSAHANLEQAEDQAKLRALMALGLTATPIAVPEASAAPLRSPLPDRIVPPLPEPSLPEAPPLPPAYVVPDFAPALTPPPAKAPSSDGSWELPAYATSEPLAETDFAPIAPADPGNLGDPLTPYDYEANYPTFPPTPDLPPVELVSAASEEKRASKRKTKASGESTTVSLPEPLPEVDRIDRVPSEPTTPVDRSEEIAQIGVEMKRLGWTTEQGRSFLKQSYNKRSRQELADSELMDFLGYLQSQPSPVTSPF